MIYIYLNLSFIHFEIILKKVSRTYLYVTCAQSCFTKKLTHRLARVKKIKYGANIKAFTTHVLSFYIDQKNLIKLYKRT
jgi:hypothetical protein